MKHNTLREEIIATAKRFNSTGLSVGTSGNLSARTKAGLLITPTGVSYEDLGLADIVEIDLQGNTVNGNLKPSSEWRFHCDIYREKEGTMCIVHVHSTYATAIACTGQGIPPFHYMVARAGGDSIRCAEYATFGTEELSQNALIALQDRQACLLANHGLIALGEDIAAAFSLAQEVEELARQYCISRQVGQPKLLDKEEMEVNLRKFRHYGKQDIRED